MKQRVIVLVGLVALLISGVFSKPMSYAQDKDESQTKIRKIVLYKHGMGYFEREGKVNGNATITLSFKTAQMKDLLTSLFAIDLDGGQIRTVGYDSKDPIDKQLENILIRVPQGAALTQFLAQLKGARIEVKIGDDTTRGHILGIEPVQQKVDDSILTAYKLVLLGEDGAIKPFNLLEITSMKLLDEPIQKDLKRILDIYLKSKYTDRKTVQIETRGKGERNILIGYLIEMPIWKTSYRLILNDKEKPFLQGWAILENPTDEDWDDVQMSFVACNPISFKLDLYTSYYPPRPTIHLSSLIPTIGNLFKANQLAREGASGGSAGGRYGTKGESYRRQRLAKKAEDKGIYREKNKNMRYEMEMDESKMNSLGAPMASMPMAAPRKPLSQLLTSSISAIATGTNIGELFSYEAKTPITVKRHKAAMVPIITEKIAGDKILYYRSNISPRLMNAFYLTNSTDLTLETGPVTLFEGSTSVGEGLMRKSLGAGMKEIIPYAIETGCSIEPIYKSNNQPVHKAKLTNGVLELKQYRINEVTYKCINKTGKSHTFYLDHPKAGGYKLIETKKAEEEIEGYYRFKTKLDAGDTLEFKVKEQMETASHVYLRNTSLDQIRFYINQSYISDNVKDFLKELTVIMSDVAKQQRTYNEANAEYRRLAEDQNRFRQNMRTLSTNNPTERALREKYVKKMDQVEEKIGQLRGIMLESQDKKRELEQTLIKKIQGFEED